MNKKVDEFIEVAAWREELKILRKIVLEAGLEETFKWRVPCYTVNNKNIVIISGFKEYCAISFFKGALLKDPTGILEKPGENTQEGRLIKFTSKDQILAKEKAVTAFIKEAIQVEESGLKLDTGKRSDLEYPEELVEAFKNDPDLENAFEALTPGRKRAYIIHFNGAKQSTTRTARIVKYTRRILEGKGFNDCVCGHTKRPPNCDGSHKLFGIKPY